MVVRLRIYWKERQCDSECNSSKSLTFSHSNYMQRENQLSSESCQLLWPGHETEVHLRRDTSLDCLASRSAIHKKLSLDGMQYSRVNPETSERRLSITSTGYCIRYSWQLNLQALISRSRTYKLSEMYNKYTYSIKIR